MKEIRCHQCKIIVAYIENGSKLKNGSVMLCADCERKRIALQMAADLDSIQANRANNNMSTFMDSLFKQSKGGS